MSYSSLPPSRFLFTDVMKEEAENFAEFLAGYVVDIKISACFLSVLVLLKCSLKYLSIYELEDKSESSFLAFTDFAA